MKHIKKYDIFINENKLSDFFNDVGQKIKKMFNNPDKNQKIEIEESEKQVIEDPKDSTYKDLIDVLKSQQEQQLNIKNILIQMAEDINKDLVSDLKKSKIVWKQTGVRGLNQIWYHFKNGNSIYFEFVNGGRGSTIIYKKSNNISTTNMNVFFTNDFINLFNDIYTITRHSI